jgi:tetratricopeptide (TPR) repeat protein
MAARGDRDGAQDAFTRAREHFMRIDDGQYEGVVAAYMSQAALWAGQTQLARELAELAWDRAQRLRLAADLIRAARLRGEAAVARGDLSAAAPLLEDALTRARAVQLVEEELAALIALGELQRRLGNLNDARSFLAEVWPYAERGPYPLLHADACLALARIEHDAGDHAAAIEAAEAAGRHASCDGPPYAYAFGLDESSKLLRMLQA